MFLSCSGSRYVIRSRCSLKFAQYTAQAYQNRKLRLDSTIKWFLNYAASTRLVCLITVNRKPCQNSSSALIFFTLMGYYTLKVRAPLDLIN